MAYQITHHRLFEKEILKLPSHHQQKIYRLITRLSHNPKQFLPNSSPIKGYHNVFRTRLGSFRLIYHLNHQKQLILLLGIQPRGKIYQTIRRLLS